MSERTPDKSGAECCACNEGIPRSLVWGTTDTYVHHYGGDPGTVAPCTRRDISPGAYGSHDSHSRYRTIVADPPWHYPHGHPAREHKKHPYSTMTIGELCALPVSDWADQSAHLYLWTTNEHLRYAFSVLGAWGFTFKNVITWCKPGLGMGGTFRNSTEIVLLGERGKCELKRRDVGTWHVWPNPKENSRKPDAFLDLVESVSHGPYLEMFARRNRLNWHTWGNEALPHIEYTTVGVPDLEIAA